MPGRVIGTSMSLGYPGAFARTPDCIIMNRIKKTDGVNVNFGDAVILNTDNTYSKFGATGTLAKFAGFAVREVKQSVNFLDQSAVAYEDNQPCDVLQRGAVSIVCNVGTPTAGGKVYIRITANGAIPAGVVGGIEAAADGSNTIELTNCRFATGLIDADKVTEVTILERNNP